MKINEITNCDKIGPNKHNDDDIYHITQFYIDKNSCRNRELRYCLKRNIQLGIFKKIYLINERVYSQTEMGLNDDEIKHVEQVNLNGQRMTYGHALQTAVDKRLVGYIVISNTDIFFDQSLLNARRSCLSWIKSLYALIRFEYDKDRPLEKCQLYRSPKVRLSGTQDTWILHTNHLPNIGKMENYHITLGKPGCDNAIAYRFHKMGYKLYNEPNTIRTYHYHTSNSRTYKNSDRIPQPYLRVYPCLKH